MNQKIWENILATMLSSGQVIRVELNKEKEIIIFIEDEELFKWEYNKEKNTIIIVREEE